MNTNWLDIIKQFLLKKGLLGVGFGLIAAGIDMVAGGFIWEYLAELLFNRIFKNDPDPGLSSYRISTSIIFILTGFGFIIRWFWIEKKKKFISFEFISYHLVISSYHPNTSHEEWENLKDPTYEFQVNFQVKTGNKGVLLNELSIDRFIEDQICRAYQPKIKNCLPGSYWKNQPNSKGELPEYFEPHSDHKSYEGLRVNAGQTRNFLLTRKAKGSNPNMFGSQMTYGKGKYRMRVKYNFEDEPKSQNIELFSEEEKTNKLTAIKEL